MSDIRQAILKAADHIERNPNSFDYCRAITTPRQNGSGCYVGWIAFFAGEEPGQERPNGAPDGMHAKGV